ncbi:serine/threonine protein phosphatase, partial [Streptomyces sp. NPDC042898]
MTEHPTSHEGRQPLAARPQERARPRQEAAAGLPSDVPAQPGGPADRTATAPGTDATVPNGTSGTSRTSSAPGTPGTPGTPGATAESAGPAASPAPGPAS